MTGTSYDYGHGHRTLEVAGIAVFIAMIFYLIAQVVVSMMGDLSLWALGLSLLGGYLLADFLSGMAHWAGDSLGNEATPLVGPAMIKPFREHHVDPKDICRHDFIQTNGNNCIVSVPILALVIVFLPAAPGVGLCIGIVFASAAWFIVMANQFHKWAHADRIPRPVMALQRWGLILSPAHHAIHHAPPHDKYYCIVVGWLNPLLMGLRFFQACEWLIARVHPSFLYLDKRRD
jgi:ubiquitin-conjugating enzyme E2 variant